MPTQEDRVLARFKQIRAMIRDSKRISRDLLEAWGFATLGIRSRTMSRYVDAFLKMKTLSRDPKTQDLVWPEKES